MADNIKSVACCSQRHAFFCVRFESLRDQVECLCARRTVLATNIRRRYFFCKLITRILCGGNQVKFELLDAFIMLVNGVNAFFNLFQVNNFARYCIYFLQARESIFETKLDV